MKNLLLKHLIGDEKARTDAGRKMVSFVYTGVTRGRKLVVMVGMKRALAIGVKNDKTQKRYTHLRERLSTAPHIPY